MSEIINLAKGNGDDHVYEEAIILASKKLKNDYSFIIQVWNHELPEQTKHPKVLISTSDESHQIPIQINNYDYVHIFKQYAPMENADIPMSVQSISNVTPIPLCHLEGVIDRGLSIFSRKYDWSWMGQFDPYRRVEFKHAIDKAAQNSDLNHKVLWYNGWNQGDKIENYSNIVNNTRIMPVPCGSGSLESFRFFEAMMCGCVVFNTGLPSTDFYNNAPYVKLNHWGELIEVMDHILTDNDQMQEISHKSKEWYKKYCSPEALSELISCKLEGQK